MPITVSQRSMIGGIVFCLLAGVSMARIISTYKVFSQTTDEPARLITGMEWLQRGTYTFEPLHPPLARAAIAMGPYLYRLLVQNQTKRVDSRKKGSTPKRASVRLCR
jgi:hypothetical protein